MLENEIILPKALRRNAYYRYQYQRKTPFTHCRQKNGNRGQLAKDRYNRQELTHVYFQFVQSKYKKTTIENVSRIPLLQRSLVMEPSVAPAGRFRVVVLLVGRSLITCLQVGGTLPTLQ